MLAVVNRTLIVESQALFAKALAQMLAADPSIQVVGDADSITEAHVRATQPDLIIIDIDGGQFDLVEAVQTCRNISPKVRICALSSQLQVEVLQRCLNAGTDGYLVKDLTPNEFLRAVKSVAAGESYVDPRLAGQLLRRRSNQRFPDPADLSMREIDVAFRLSQKSQSRLVIMRAWQAVKCVAVTCCHSTGKFECKMVCR